MGFVKVQIPTKEEKDITKQQSISRQPLCLKYD